MAPDDAEGERGGHPEADVIPFHLQLDVDVLAQLDYVDAQDLGLGNLGDAPGLPEPVPRSSVLSHEPDDREGSVTEQQLVGEEHPQRRIGIIRLGH